MTVLYTLNLVFQEEYLNVLFIYFCSWQEALTVYPRTNKQNHKKKRKVDPQTHQVMTTFTYSVVK